MDNESKTGEFNIQQDLNNAQTNKNSVDDFVIGSGFKFNDDVIPTQNDMKNTKKRSKRRSKGVIKALIWIVIILAVSVTIAIGAIFCVIDYMGLGAKQNVTVTISENQSLESIADQLKEKGAIKYTWLFKLYCNTKDYYDRFLPGVHTMSTDTGYQGIVNEFTTVKGYDTTTVDVAISPMSTIDDIAELLEKNKVCTAQDFYNAVENSTFNYKFIKDIPTKQVHYRLEGYLYPDTYQFYQWNSLEGAEFAINKMLENFDNKFTEEYRQKAEKMGYSIHDVATFASIIELECSGYYKEMPKVSAVFHNRLENWGDQPKFLGSSPTADYPYGSGNYDTNKNEGLPPGPLCAMTEQAIKSVLYPDKSMKKEYFYFVTDTDFKFYYTKTIDEHNSTIASLTYQGKWGEN